MLGTSTLNPKNKCFLLTFSLVSSSWEDEHIIEEWEVNNCSHKKKSARLKKMDDSLQFVLAQLLHSSAQI